MSINPIISVLIPVYNTEKYIARCLDSIMNQTSTLRIECVLCDDCSSDESIKIAQQMIDSYRGKIDFRIIKHNKNQGIAAVRNTLIKSATGQYILSVDSDDYIEPQMVESMYNKAIEEDADIVGCNYFDSFSSKKTENNGFKCKSWTHDKDWFLEKTIDNSFTPFLWRRLIKRTLFTEHSGISSEGINIGEDALIVIPLHYWAKKCSYIDVALYNYYHNKSSITGSLKNIALHHAELLTGIERIRDFLKNNSIYERHKIAFLKRCFLAKSYYISIPSIRDYNKWKNTFSESNKYIDFYFENKFSKAYWKLLLSSPTIIRPLLYSILDLKQFVLTIRKERL